MRRSPRRRASVSDVDNAGREIRYHSGLGLAPDETEDRRRKVARRSRLRCLRGGSTDLGDEPVAPAGHRPDQIPVLSERLAQRRDLNHQVVLFDHRIRPNAAQDLVFGDEAAACLGEDHEHIEGAAAKLDRDPIGAELPAVRQQLEPTELDSPHGLVGELHGHLLRSFNEISYSIKGRQARSQRRQSI